LLFSERGGGGAYLTKGKKRKTIKMEVSDRLFFPQSQPFACMPAFCQLGAINGEQMGFSRRTFQRRNTDETGICRRHLFRLAHWRSFSTLMAGLSASISREMKQGLARNGRSA